MAYMHGWTPIRDAYEQCFSGTDGREVTVRRVVNIVERRSPGPREFDRGFNDDPWYDEPQNYQDTREYYDEGWYPNSDRRYCDDSPHFRRNSSPTRNQEGPYSQPCYNRRDLRHQLLSRNRGRASHNYRSRGRGSGPPQNSVPGRKAKPLHSHSTCPPATKRGRSPGNREAQPPVRSGSNTRSRSFSPDREKGHNHQQAQKKHKPNVPVSHTASSSVEGSPRSSGSSKEKTPASVAETEEVVAASVEPKLTPEEDFKARRLEAIKAKALEIETHYRQDCETFRTVVKMLVAKEPSLNNLLQAPLDDNLLEIKQRCLDDLRHFVKELDKIIAKGGNEPNHNSTHTSPVTHAQTEEDFPQVCSTDPTSND